MKRGKRKPNFLEENKGYVGGKKKQGVVSFDKNYDPNDFVRNKYIAEICAKHTGYDFHIREHLNVKNMTNPEYLINGKYLADRKSIQSNNGIITQIDSARTQMKNKNINPNQNPYFIVWDFDSVENLDWSKIKHNLSKKITPERGKSVKGMFFQYQGKAVYISREEIVKRNFSLLQNIM